MKDDIAILGAGLVGSLLGIYLAQKNKYNVSIYERRPDMRLMQGSAGRSINLALSDRGIKALEDVGIMEDVKNICIPMHGRQIHNADGTQTYQAYGKEGQYINSVSRGELNKKLMDLAEAHGVEIFFEKKCEDINWKNNEVHFSGNNNMETISPDLIFGSDGAYAASRLSYQLNHDRFEYHQTFIDYGYKELTIPAGENGSFLIEKNALHIWPRGNYMLIALPNIDGSFTCTLFFPYSGDPSFESLDSKKKVDSFFKNEFADAYKLMPGITEDFFNNPTASLVTVKCFPWTHEDKFSLIGDAAHAMVPFFGQGMNCGFEDCLVLNQLWEAHQGNWTEILPKFQESRKPDADAISDLALANFTEMRDKVADEKFLAQKKIEAAFSTAYPEQWTPAYSMVTFRPDMRYSEALNKGMAQQKIMDSIMSAERDTSWEWNETTEAKMKAALQ